MKAVTAVVSLVTAGVLVSSLPSLLSMPTAHRMNDRLEAALRREQTLSAELAGARDELERRTALATLRHRKMTSALVAAGVAACRWEIESGDVDWEVGFSDAAYPVRALAGRVFKSWRHAMHPDLAARIREQSLASAAAGTPMDFHAPLPEDPSFVLRISAAPEPPVAGQPRYMVGMFRIIPAGHA